MKISRKWIIHWTLLILCITIIWIVRYFPPAGEFYARNIYPGIAALLSAFSSLFPFSVGDCFIFGSITGIVGLLIYTLLKKRPLKLLLYRIALFLCWVYIWFYFAWGLNYFREDFYTRTGIEYKAYTPEHFKQFLTGYIAQLNTTYTSPRPASSLPIQEEIQKGYFIIADSFGLTTPFGKLKVKPMLSSPLMSKVGVTGYMGPFFTEFNLNKELRDEEYPAVYAHETAHRLNIAGEAEANFYAWLVCTRSDVPEIRYSGNFLLLGYVLNNASRLLPEEEFRTFLKTIRPEVIEQYRSYQTYWRKKYSPAIGRLQNTLYNFFLKSNRIPSGTKNYSEVIGLVISYQEMQRTHPGQ